MNVRNRDKARWNQISPDKAFWLLAFFAAVVFLMGGGSRHDIASVGPLRFVAAIVLATGIFFQTAETFKRIAPLVIMLLLLAILMIVQLVPLPYYLWSSLPEREVIVETGELLGLSGVWRPLTFSPVKTANSLASLIVPFAALMLLALLNDAGWSRVRVLVIIAGVASAVLGMAQLFLSRAPGLYFYDITNMGSAVGLFANRNHNALLLNIALLFSLFEAWRSSFKRGVGAQLFSVASQIILVVGILVNGSRFGLVLLVFLAIFCASVFILSERSQKSGSRNPAKRKLVLGTAIAVAVGFLALFTFSARIPAVSRFFERSLDEELRAQTLPHMLDLMWDHFPYGVGFGAFEQAYRMIEPVELLRPTYLNHAHNDWLQIVIEGGVVAVCLMGVALFLLARRAFLLQRERRSGDHALSEAWLGLLSISMIALHSLVDYPLRVPSIMLVCTVCLGMFFRPLSSLQKR